MRLPRSWMTVRPRISWPLSRLSSAALLTLILAGCDSQQSAEKHFEKAQRFIEQGDSLSATVELKNVLQVDAHHSKARKSLADTYFSRGLFLDADKEYRKSMTAGVKANLVLPQLIETNILLGRFSELDRITSEYSLSDAAAITNAAALTSIGHSLANNNEKALAWLTRAKNAGDSNLILLAEAYLNAVTREVDQAAVLARGLSPTLETPLVGILKGRLLTQARDFDSAIAIYRKLSDRFPAHAPFEILVAQTLLAANRLNEAKPIVERLLQLNERNPHINQLMAAISAREGDFKAAQQHAETTLIGTANEAAQIIAGLSAYRQKQYEQAYRHLKPLEDRFGPTHPATFAMLDLNQRFAPNEQPSTTARTAPEEAEELELLAQASAQFLRHGQVERAVENARQAYSRSPGDAEAEALYGKVAALAGLPTGVIHLQNALEKDPSITSARLTLAKQLVREGKHEQALGLANDWIALAPERPEGFLLAGLINTSAGNTIRAAENFRSALAITPNNLSARVGLSDILLEAGKFEEAAITLTEAFDINSNHRPTLVRMVQLARINTSEQISPDLFIQKIQHAKGRASRASIPILTTTEATLHIIAGEYPKALQVLEELPAATRSAAQSLLIGDIHLHQGEFERAKYAYSSALQDHPQNVILRLRNIGVLEAEQQNAKALTLAITGLNQAPTNGPLTLVAANLYLKTAQLERAAQILDGPAASNLESAPQYWKLKGVIAMELKKQEDGVQALTRYYEKETTTAAALLLASAHKSSGNTANAIILLKDHEQDLSAQLMLASLYEGDGQAGPAVELYGKVLQQQPDHAIALNNLALLLADTGSPVQALEHAQRAYEIAPGHPAILDTYGSLLLQFGRTDEALQMLTSAYEIAPYHSDIATHYASALQQAGQSDKAIAVLQQHAISERTE